jgi:hypothetical protein
MKRANLLIVVLLTFAIAGCGSTALSASSSTKPTALYVARIHTIPSNYHDFNRTITGASAIQHLYHTGLALPKVIPGKVMMCTVDAGVVYDLTFELPSSTSHMELDASGCELLTISKTDVRITNPTFMASVERVIGVPCLLATNVSADGQVQKSIANNCSGFIL